MISVIIITKNRPTLQRAIDSINNQTIKDVELIVEHCADNLSCGEIAFNKTKLLNNITSEWVTFLDDDDYWYPTFLEECTSHSNMDVIIVNNQYQLTGPIGNIGAILSIGQSVSPGSCIIYKTSAIKNVNGFNHKMGFNAPYELMVKLYANNYKFHHIPKPLVYVEHQQNDNIGFIDIEFYNQLKIRTEILNNYDLNK